MEKDGWLDRLLLGLLNILNQTWLNIAVALVGGLLVAFLARRAPGEDWAYIKEGPGKLLFAAFAVLAVLKSAPRFVLPKTSFVCDKGPGPLGIEVSTNCRWVSGGVAHYEFDYTFADLFRDIAVSALQDLVYGGLGAVLGIGLATVLKHSSDPRPSA